MHEKGTLKYHIYPHPDQSLQPNGGHIGRHSKAVSELIENPAPGNYGE